MIRYILPALLLALPAAAATDLKYNAGTNGYGSSITLASTELNTLANGSQAEGAAVNNSSGQRAIYADIVYTAGGTSTPTAPASIGCWFKISTDGGSNYTDGSASVTPGRAADFTIIIRAGTTITPVDVTRNVLLPPGAFKVLCVNNTGVTLPASGNTIVAWPVVLRSE